ncbi:hypothetical protein AALC16_18750 [Lachnospiraceae bacterium 29-91]
MGRKIECREYKRQDKKELTRILAEQIYNKFFEKEKDAEKYSNFILERAIGACKYKKVAVIGNKVVGAVFGIKKDGNNLLSFLKEKICYMQLKVRKKNKEALKYLLLLDEMEQELLIQNHVYNESMIVLFLLKKRPERSEIQEVLLKQWESMISEQKNCRFYIVANSRTESRMLDRYNFQKVDEKSTMIQPKEQRARFYKILYRNKIYM